eukprot:TRINITY_DN5261_c0_g1_i1.p1 TRINITY_DN5261_c0_g1~~TRINITY_DN5261_c0_g1_i1.p1  ORF type:complete len:324 (-),score=83.56 TRINITY_DN5261_c0_g1_i1:166-1032(-)
MQRLNAHVKSEKIPSYLINLDPACANVPFSANIDIRDSLNYKDVMKQYSLGPNGGIITALNIFSASFSEVMKIVDKRAPSKKYMFIDTPGQIEVFNWSASGTIVTQSFANTYPTCYIYVVDTPRSANPITFMSNMLYACSLLYKSRLPLIIVFSKTDILNHSFIIDWMSDYELFEEALQAANDTYMSNFTQSMGFMLEEFYKNLTCVGVSSVTGEGIDDLLNAMKDSVEEYKSGYKADLEEMIAEKERKEEERKLEDLARYRRDRDVVIDVNAESEEDKAFKKLMSQM